MSAPMALLLAWELGVGNTTDAIATLLIAIAGFTALVVVAAAVTYIVGRGVHREGTGQS